MIHQLSENVFWGDKPSAVESIGKVGSIINVAHALRKPYWSDLGQQPWEVWTFRLASPDREPLDDSYMEALLCVVHAIRIGKKLPVLCHCRAGGHRGPTSALFVHWALSGQKTITLEEGIERICEVKPKYNRFNPRRVYKNMMLDWCRRNSQS